VTTEEWNRVKELFDAALRQLPAERDAFLESQTDSATVLDEVRSLLRTYEEQPGFLEGALPRWPETDAEPVIESPLAGRRIGPWKLLREIGRGGMGVVWEAQRADDQYQQRAAVKLLPASLLDRQSIERFREERQILASLEHPGIARLLDGGTLDDGSPYLVMEFVEGPTLDVWCDGGDLSLRARLEIFLSVSMAVEYAHHHLVIHRDIKPANILVTPEGVPKLLDFGIAKLMRAEGVSAPSTRRLLTPEFASPEQLRGDVVTTASDVFSLGVLLYLLLTGRRPFAGAGEDTLELVRVICEEEPPLPSAAGQVYTRELRGELDAIILQALRKNPEERYPSARALAEDLRAWLEGREVTAVRQPWWRRCAKYVRRHKTQSAALAAAVVSLVAGTGVSLWQANVAERQRERAERRFRDVRRFGRSVLFELHDAIRNLPGATPARNLLLTRATEFLDDLANDPACDAAMKLELAEGYDRLGNVQGGGFSENIGRRNDAIASFKKSIRLGEAALAASPGVDASLVLLDTYDDLTRAYLDKSDRQQAELWHKKYADLAAALEARYPADLRAQAAVARSYSVRAFYQTQLSDFAGARELYRKALQVFADVQGKGVDTKNFRTDYSFALKRLGALLIVDNSLDEAERCYRRALGMDDAEVASEPGNMTVRLNRTFTLSDLAMIAKRRNDLTDAATLYGEALGARRQAVAGDPGNLRYLSLAASASINLAKVESGLKQHHDAIRLAREAVTLTQRAAGISKERKEVRELARSQVALAVLIYTASSDKAFHAGLGEALSDANAALLQARPAVPTPKPNEILSPADEELHTNFEEVRKQLQIFSTGLP
jgi:non-specific serine/threonine protein kinase/serine/threonine-protein kinase